ncbi:MAG: copper amine oxidase N-terminal domain-containing protein [Clostridiales bacterium]|nr:copper amine oxidase N-terminal domain-containing protein [Clostridiales bacterium]
MGFLQAFGWDSITVIINGEELDCETEPMLINGRTMLPVRDIFFEAFGTEVSYEAETKTVMGLKGDKVIVLTVGSNII